MELCRTKISVPGAWDTLTGLGAVNVITHTGTLTWLSTSPFVPAGRTEPGYGKARQKWLTNGQIGVVVFPSCVRQSFGFRDVARARTRRSLEGG